jgi:hypothetical protein
VHYQVLLHAVWWHFHARHWRTIWITIPEDHVQVLWNVPHCFSHRVNLKKYSNTDVSNYSKSPSMLSDVCAGFGPILSNTEVNTHLCMESETSSALNLALCGPDLVVHLEWVFLPHYELHISSHHPTSSWHLNWIFSLADWEGFSQSAICGHLKFLIVNSMAYYFMDIVLHAADCHIPRSSSSLCHVTVPWCTDEHQDAIILGIMLCSTLRSIRQWLI